MADIGLGAYRATAATALSTELDADTDGTYVASAAIDNSTNLDMFIDIEVFLASFTPAANGFVSIFLIGALEGTTFEDGDSTTVPPPGARKYTRGLTAAAQAHRLLFPQIPLLPGQFRIGEQNNSGATYAGTGNLVRYRTYKLNST